MLDGGVFTSDPTSVFARTIFTRRSVVPMPLFIRAMHPKTAVLPEPAAIRRILAAGWVGQLKIHGHRAQLHVPSIQGEPIIAYTRQGKRHGKALPSAVEKELRRIFTPAKGWNVLDAEWVKSDDRLYVFDLLKEDGTLLRSLAYPDRWKRLPRHFISPHVTILPLLKTLPACLEALASPDPRVEGLVFKSSTSPGFSDTSIVRCRKRATRG